MLSYCHAGGTEEPSRTMPWGAWTAFGLLISGSASAVLLAGEPASSAPAQGLRLPATFLGVLPCADCPGIRNHLDLWADGVFHLRREWLGPKDLIRDDIGRWTLDAARNAIVLRGGAEMPLQFEIVGPLQLRALDTSGGRIESHLPYELKSNGTLTPTVVSLTLNGEMRYMADAATFIECLTGRRYPIATERAYPDLEAGYLKAVREPGAALYVSFEGSIVERRKMEGKGTQPTVVVRHYIKASPGASCERTAGGH